MLGKFERKSSYNYSCAFYSSREICDRITFTDTELSSNVGGDVYQFLKCRGVLNRFDLNRRKSQLLLRRLKEFND